MGNAFRHFPLENASLAFEPQHAGYTYAGVVFCNEFQYHKASPELGGSTLQFSFFPYFITNLIKDEDFIKMIEMQREIVDGPLNTRGQGAYPYSDTITFGTVSIHIEPIRWRALAINTAVLTCLTWFFLKSFFVAVVSVPTCVMGVIEIYGVMMTGEAQRIPTSNEFRELRELHRVSGSLPYKKTFGLPIRQVSVLKPTFFTHPRGAQSIVLYR